MIDLSFTETTDKVMKGFADSNFLTKINELSLSGCLRLTDAGISHFIVSNNAKLLRKLDLSLTDITDLGLNYIRESIFSKNLTHLLLGACQNITDKGVTDLILSEKVKNLEYLELAETNISDYTIEALSKSKFVSKLRHLNISSCPISDYGIE